MYIAKNPDQQMVPPDLLQRRRTKTSARGRVEAAHDGRHFVIASAMLGRRVCQILVILDLDAEKARAATYPSCTRSRSSPAILSPTASPTATRADDRDALRRDSRALVARAIATRARAATKGGLVHALERVDFFGETF